MKYLLVTALLVPAIVAPVQASTQIQVNTQGQVRNSFNVFFPDGSSFSFSQGEHIWVVAKVMEGGSQIGWICSAHGRSFFVQRNNVQI